jgi:hypothetical protein
MRTVANEVVSMSEVVQRALEKHLRRTEAPAGLADRVFGAERRTVAAVPAALPWAMAGWALAAGVVLAVGATYLWRADSGLPTVEAMAVAALERPVADMEIRTDDAESVRRWVKAQSGIEIMLPPKHADVVRINGARLIPANGTRGRLAEISYEVGQYRAALLVSKDRVTSEGYPQHDFRDSDPYRAARVSSWTLRGQSYTLAWTAPGEFRTACLLCHDQEPTALPPSAVN